MFKLSEELKNQLLAILGELPAKHSLQAIIALNQLEKIEDDTSIE